MNDLRFCTFTAAAFAAICIAGGVFTANPVSILALIFVSLTVYGARKMEKCP